MQRVLMVARIVPPAYSGAGLQAARLAAALCARGVDVTIITTTSNTSTFPRRDELDGVTVLRRPTFGTSGRLQKAALLGAILLHLLRHPRRYDWVHLHGAAHVLRLLRFLKPLLGFEVVYKATLAGMDDALVIRSAHGAKLLEVVDRWACVSSPIVVAALDAGVSPERIVRIPNGVDRTRFRPSSYAERRAARLKLGIPEDARVWLSLGAVCGRKRQHLLVEAWRRLADPTPLLLIAGPEGVETRDVAYAARLRDAIRRAGLESRIRLIPSQEDVPSLYAIADGLVSASEAEGLPNAVLEALAAGLPVVCTPVAASADIEALGGDRVRIVDPNELAAAIDEFVGAIRDVPSGIADCDLAGVAARYEQLYRRLPAHATATSEPSHA